MTGDPDWTNMDCRIFGWWHARKRTYDRRIMVPAIQSRTASPSRRLAAFQLFAAQKGQEHWHCACAREDRAEVERLLGPTRIVRRGTPSGTGTNS